MYAAMPLLGDFGFGIQGIGCVSHSVDACCLDAGCGTTQSGWEKEAGMDGWMDGWRDGWMDGWTDGQIDEEIERWIKYDGWREREREREKQERKVKRVAPDSEMNKQTDRQREKWYLCHTAREFCSADGFDASITHIPPFSLSAPPREGENPHGMW
jgi:hypothetical protein